MYFLHLDFGRREEYTFCEKRMPRGGRLEIDMSCEALFATIDSLYEKYVGFLADVCNIESPTSDKAGVDAVGRYFAEAAHQRGWLVERFPHPTAGDVVSVTMNAQAKGAPITLSGHMDTVHPHGLFGTPPVRIEGDKLYGPGAIDCKGGIVAAFYAMDALCAVGFTDRPVRLLLQSDEEGGSKASGKATIRYMCEKAADSAAFINLEPFGDGRICVQRKGIVTFRFAVTGKEAHASQCARAGANAIAEAAHKILEMEKLKDNEGLTCSVGVIRGGSVPNTVAGYCEFYANVRYATQAQYEEVVAYAKRVAETVHVDGCTCEVTESGSRLCMERTERNLALAEKINGIFAANGLPTLAPAFNLGGSDAAEITAAGIPCVDSLGTSGGGVHSADEWTSLASLTEAAKRLAAIVYCF